MEPVKSLLHSGTEKGMFVLRWGNWCNALERPRSNIPPHVVPWLLAAIVTVPLAFILGALRWKYHWDLGFTIPWTGRPMELLGLWLACYWGVMAARWLWRQMQG